MKRDEIKLGMPVIIKTAWHTPPAAVGRVCTVECIREGIVPSIGLRIPFDMDGKNTNERILWWYYPMNLESVEKHNLPEIRFYIREEPYGFLSNFWRSMQKVGIRSYPTNEHFYQSMKARLPEIQHWIETAPTAKLAMSAGRSLTTKEIVGNWEHNKVSKMLVGLRAKFEDPNLRLMLDWTGDAILIEDSPTDMFWGGKLPNSKNMLGKLLMHVREENRKDSHIDFKE